MVFPHMGAMVPLAPPSIGAVLISVATRLRRLGEVKLKAELREARQAADMV